MMELNFICKPGLPPLAWAVVKPADSRRVTVFHGPAVECRDRFFVAGVWESDFESGGIDEAYALQGSGGVLNADGSGLTLCTSSNMQDALFSVSRNDLTVISNSLAFLMSLTELSLDPDCYEYEYILNSSFFGLEKYAGTLPADGADISIWRHAHISLTDSALLGGVNTPVLRNSAHLMNIAT